MKRAQGCSILLVVNLNSTVIDWGQKSSLTSRKWQALDLSFLGKLRCLQDVIKSLFFWNESSMHCEALEASKIVLHLD